MQGSCRSASAASVLLAALVRLTLAGASRDAISPYPFLGTYLMIAGVAVLMQITALTLDLRKPAGTVKLLSGRLGAAFRQPRFVIVVLAGHHRLYGDGPADESRRLQWSPAGWILPPLTQVIQWHVLGIFTLALIVGQLIEHFGLMPMMLAGCLLMAMAGDRCRCLRDQRLAFQDQSHAAWPRLVGPLFIGASTLVSLPLLPAEQGPGQARQ